VDEWVGTCARVKIAMDDVGARTDDDRDLSGPKTASGVTARFAGLDDEQLVAVQRDAGLLAQLAIMTEPQDVDEVELVRAVEEVGQPSGVEPKLARERAVSRVRDEVQVVDCAAAGGTGGDTKASRRTRVAASNTPSLRGPRRCR